MSEGKFFQSGDTYEVPMKFHVGKSASTAAESVKNAHQDVLLRWDKLNLSLGSGSSQKRILHEVSGQAREGRVLGIMGPSGSGKTTLLNTLAHRIAVDSGTIYLRDPCTQPGQGLSEGYSRLRASDYHHRHDFVPQDDALLGALSVYDSVRYTGMLRGFAGASLEAQVSESLKDLGLICIKSLPAGTMFKRGISGGERRRLSIALGIIGGRPLVFLDEPTTGLDSAAALQIMIHVGMIAKANSIAIVCSIHQPSSAAFAMLDDLLLLSAGRVVYEGAAKDANAYFSKLGYPIPETGNPADAFSCILADFDFTRLQGSAQSSVSHLVLLPMPTTVRTHTQSRSMAEALSITSSAGYPTSQLQQILILTRRGVRNTFNEPFLLILRVGLYLVLGVMVGTLWYRVGESPKASHERLSVLYFTLQVITFLSISGAPSFIEQRAVFQREYATGLYSAFSYTVAFALTSLPFVSIVTGLYTPVVYYLLALRPGVEHISIFASVIFLELWISEVAVSLLAAVAPDFMMVVSLYATILVTASVTSGFLIHHQNIPWFWMPAHYCSHWKYGLEILAQNELKGVALACFRFKGRCFCEYQDKLNRKCKFLGESLLKALHFMDYDITYDFKILWIMLGVTLVFFWMALYFDASRLLITK